MQWHQPLNLPFPQPAMAQAFTYQPMNGASTIQCREVIRATAAARESSSFESCGVKLQPSGTCSLLSAAISYDFQRTSVSISALHASIPCSETSKLHTCTVGRIRRLVTKSDDKKRSVETHIRGRARAMHMRCSSLHVFLEPNFQKYKYMVV